MKCSAELFESKFIASNFHSDFSLVLDKRSENFKTKEKSTVLDILNCTSSKIGSRHLSNLLITPLQNLDDINFRLDLVSIFIEEWNLTIKIREILNKVSDVGKIVFKLLKFKNSMKESSISLEECMSLNESLAYLKALQSVLKLHIYKNNEYKTIIEEFFIIPLESVLTKCSKLIELLDKILIFDKNIQEVRLNHKMDSELAKVQESIDGCWEKIDRIKDDISSNIVIDDGNKRKSSQVKEVKIFVQELREQHVITLPNSHKENLSNSKYNIFSITKAHVNFTSAELGQISKKLNILKSEYNKISKSLTSRVLNVMATYIEVLENLIFLIGEIDVFTSFANLIKSSKNIYSRPTITKNKEMKIINGRHFILDQNEGMINNNFHRETPNLVSNNCIFNDNNTVILVTGVNMGGKTTYLRQVGLIVFLAHLGMFVPCDPGTVIPLTDRIITRVGADDNLLKGMSTFYSEMNEVASMLQNCTESSLLLIDEIGRGTSTNDGIALSYGIIKSIAKDIKSFCIFATHFHELTKINFPEVNNYRMEYNVEENKGLILKYKLVEGASNVSMGVELLKNMNMPYLVEKIENLK